MEKRWAPTSAQGAEFESFVTDPNNLFKKSLEPLVREPIHTDAFKRTTKAANAFKSE